MRLFLILCGTLIGIQVMASDKGLGFPDAVEAVSPVSWDGQLTPVNNQGITPLAAPPPLPRRSGFLPHSRAKAGAVPKTYPAAVLNSLENNESDDDELNCLVSLHPRFVPHSSPAPTVWTQKVHDFKVMKDKLSSGLGKRSPTPLTEAGAKAYFLNKPRYAGLKVVGNLEFLACFEAAKALAEAE